jgi:hypothetical protein
LDVIGQGREPERDFRLPVPLPRRWRVRIAVAAVVVIGVLAVACFLLRHAAGAPGATVPPPTSRVLTGVPAPAGNQNFFVCAPSARVCSVRINVVGGNASRIVRTRPPAPR